MEMKTCITSGCEKPKLFWRRYCKDCQKHRQVIYNRRYRIRKKAMKQKHYITEDSARGDFIYQNGYRLNVIDLGITGIKLELESDVDCAAIMLPPEKRIELGNWLIAGMQKCST